MAAERIERVVRGRFTAKRRASFLAALAESGNVRLACAAAGVSSNRAYVERRGDVGFAAAWAEALGAAEERLDGERGDRGELVVRRSCRGRLQRRIARVNDWTEETDAVFLGVLVETANVSLAAAAAGRNPSNAYLRRQRHPAFREAWDAALDEGMMRLEWMLIERAGAVLQSPAPLPAGGGTGDAAAVAAADPALALALLKYHAAKKAGTRRPGGRPRREPDMRQVRDSILTKLAAIERHRDDQR